MRTSELTSEVIIWDNASSDETHKYLQTLTDPRFRIIRAEKNIGVNAYARAFRLAQGTHLIELDDDVVDAPNNWDATLFHAFQVLPGFGYVAANLVDHPDDVQARIMYRLRPEHYRFEEVSGYRLKVGGPIGGWCGLTSRDLHDRVGGWQEKRQAFWQEEDEYLRRIERLGFRAAYLDDLRVRHAGGPFYSVASDAKLRYLRQLGRRNKVKNVVKAGLLAVPYFARLNAKNDWFEPPQQRWDWVGLYRGRPDASDGRAAGA